MMLFLLIPFQIVSFEKEKKRTQGRGMYGYGANEGSPGVTGYFRS